MHLRRAVATKAPCSAYVCSLIDMSAPELIQVNLSETLTWEARSAARQKPL